MIDTLIIAYIAILETLSLYILYSKPKRKYTRKSKSFLRVIRGNGD